MSETIEQQAVSDAKKLGVTISTFVLRHAIWLVALGVGLYGFHEWKMENVARHAAEVKVASDEQTVAQLQTSINQNNQAIQSLQQQITQRDAVNAATIKAIVQQKATVTTPQQIA